MILSGKIKYGIILLTLYFLLLTNLACHMFESSQDLLYVVLSLCILWFTVFLCWLIYQAARVLGNANKIVESLMQKLELITEAVEFMRRKMEKMSGHMGIVSKLASGVVDKFVLGKISDKLEEKVSARKTKKKTKKKKHKS